MTQHFVGPRVGKYRTIAADPAWPERGGGKIKRGADRHYDLMSVKDIIALPVSELAAPQAHLYLWVTNNYLPDGFKVMAAWGFRYVTTITWGKPTSGLGQYFRGRSEHCLFGVRGSLPYRITEDGKRAQGVTFFEESIEEDIGAYFTEARPDNVHSRKPERILEMAEIVSHGPYLEMFCRTPRPNWDSWGNELEKENVKLVEYQDSDDCDP